MPTYDYRCTACRHEFELFQSMKDAPKRKCPSCAKNALERLIGTGAAVLFKGSGFYETDYRSKSYKDAAKKEKESTSPKSDGASESKPGKTDATPSPSKPESKTQSNTQSKTGETKSSASTKAAS